jgi:DHA1 family tetracycline resistance protein-like MFS transporter
MDRTRALILAVGFCDMMGIGLIVPALPYISDAFAASPFLTTWLAALYPLTQAIGSVFLGRLSDRFGREPVIAWSVLGSAAANLAFGLGTAFVWLCAARAFTGFMAGNQSVAHAFLADRTEPAERPRVLGIFDAACSLGFIFGQAASALAGLALEGRAASLGPFMILAGPQVLLFLLLPRRGRARAPGAAAEPARLSFREMLRYPSMPPLLLFYYLTTLVFIGFATIAPLYFAKVDGASQATIAGIFTGMSLGLALVRATIVGPASDRLGARAGVAAAFAAMGAGLFLFPAGHLDLTLLASLAALVLGYGVLVPLLLAQISNRVPESRLGSALGFAGMANNLGSVSGPLAAGFLFGSFGASAPFLVAASLCVPIAISALLLPLSHLSVGAEPEATR